MVVNPSRPIGNAKDRKRFFFRHSGGRRRRQNSYFAAALPLSWFLRIITMMVFRSRHSPYPFVVHRTNGNGIANLFCSGWTLPMTASLQRRPTTAKTGAFLSIPPQQQQRNFDLNSFRTVTCNGRLGFRRVASGFSTKLFMAKANSSKKWDIGDLVHIVSKTNKIQRGEVVSIRGSGWYSVRLLKNGDSNDHEIIKCRGSQLQRLAFDSNGTNSDSGGTSIPTKSSPQLPPEIEQLDPISPEIEQLEFAMDLFEDPDIALSPPPTIYDLDAAISKTESETIGNGGPSRPITDEKLLRQAAHHATYENWVVFSDLHCSPSTLDTCLEVLEIVHKTALQQPGKCGVLFLGDFWHHRGTLRVDCLNAILGALRKWTVPMVMIPGNHDQVTLGGDNHGLTPLGNAYRVGTVEGPLILSVPTVFRKALFVPHVKDTELMKAILRSDPAHEASALFLHAEVKGAHMNDLMVSTNGLSPSIFPSNRSQRIYSGHFHKPHTIETKSSSSTIEYLGSPYQISLAEAHQQKQLVVLDANWKCHKRIPLCVGKRNFKVSSFEELEELQLDWDETISSSATAASTGPFNTRVKKGDRIVVNLPPRHQHPPPGVMAAGLDDDGHGAVWKSRVQMLRERGLMVELRETSNDAKDLSSGGGSIGGEVLEFEELSPESVWKAYLRDVQTRESINEKNSEALLIAGLKILDELEESSASPSTTVIQSTVTQRDLRLTRMSVTGFGPFEDTIEYPLDNRGLVLLRGSNVDSGPDSNGTGKSSLAMATLWGLTGSLDARPASDLKVSDVVNDNSKVARVTVEGFINDSPFVLTRSKTASKGDLTLRINDVDLTTQSTKDTQAIVEERLGVDAHILTRVAFYGQHGRNDLLEATDSKLKDELSILVPLELWQQAAAMARAKSRQAKKRVDELEGMVRLRKTDIEALSNRARRAMETRDFKRHRLIQAEEHLNRELARIQDLLDRSTDSDTYEIQEQLKDAAIEFERLNDLYDSTTKEKESQLKPLEDECIEARDAVAVIMRRSTAFDTNVRASKRALDSARAHMRRVQEKWSLDASVEIPSVLKPPERCPTCKQLLKSEGSGEETIQNALKAMEREVKEAQETLQSTEDTYKEELSKASECVDHLRAQELQLHDLQSKLQIESSKWNVKFQELQDLIREKRRIQNTLTIQLSKVVKESQLLAEREAALASFQTEQLNAAHAEEIYQNLEKDLETAKDFVEEIRSEQEIEEKHQAILSNIGERFGQRGVQTFMLQNTVDSLQRAAQIYLSYLSENSQRLELSLDAGDRILRSAYVLGADGEFRQRPLSTLSGGQWRRCSLALSLAFAELVASRGKLRSSLLVLDEPLTHLDRSGRGRFGKLVRTLLGSGTEVSSAFRISTAIVILQDLSAEELEEAFDGIDTVVRKQGKSCLMLDEMSSNTKKNIPVP